jgi:hypothetical protein
MPAFHGVERKPMKVTPPAAALSVPTPANQVCRGLGVRLDTVEETNFTPRGAGGVHKWSHVRCGLVPVTLPGHDTLSPVARAEQALREAQAIAVGGGFYELASRSLPQTRGDLDSRPTLEVLDDGSVRVYTAMARAPRVVTAEEKEAPVAGGRLWPDDTSIADVRGASVKRSSFDVELTVVFSNPEQRPRSFQFVPDIVGMLGISGGTAPDSYNGAHSVAENLLAAGFERAGNAFRHPASRGIVILLANDHEVRDILYPTEFAPKRVPLRQGACEQTAEGNRWKLTFDNGHSHRGALTLQQATGEENCRITTQDERQRGLVTYAPAFIRNLWTPRPS